MHAIHLRHGFFTQPSHTPQWTSFCFCSLPVDFLAGLFFFFDGLTFLEASDFFTSAANVTFEGDISFAFDVLAFFLLADLETSEVIASVVALRLFLDAFAPSTSASPGGFSSSRGDDFSALFPSFDFVSSFFDDPFAFLLDDDVVELSLFFDEVVSVPAALASAEKSLCRRIISFPTAAEGDLSPTSLVAVAAEGFFALSSAAFAFFLSFLELIFVVFFDDITFGIETGSVLGDDSANFLALASSYKRIILLPTSTEGVLSSLDFSLAAAEDGLSALFPSFDFASFFEDPLVVFLLDDDLVETSLFFDDVFSFPAALASLVSLYRRIILLPTLAEGALSLPTSMVDGFFALSLAAVVFPLSFFSEVLVVFLEDITLGMEAESSFEDDDSSNCLALAASNSLALAASNSLASLYTRIISKPDFFGGDFNPAAEDSLGVLFFFAAAAAAAPPFTSLVAGFFAPSLSSDLAASSFFSFEVLAFVFGNAAV
mmetsp:Transcript_25089/g.50177  ORF Transcript_25089/g.50177 Transcript_25089/m.50177 type:complete len:487 (+) Transcript_25089:829-2289(+)